MLLIPVFCIFIILHARLDAKWIKENQLINHGVEAGVALAVVTILSILTLGLSPEALSYIILFLPIRWFLFDLSLNYFRGMPLNYNGTHDKNDSQAERLLSAFPGNFQYVLKGGFFCCCILFNHFIISSYGDRIVAVIKDFVMLLFY